MRKRQKKQYRPITGQKGYEKLLDWMTREENFRWSMIGLAGYAVILLVGVYIPTNIMNRPDVGDVFMEVWRRLFPLAVVLAMINPTGSAWGLHAEEKLQKPIHEYIGEHGRCTYEELVVHFMPIKIHLGIDSAVESMLQQHELVLDTADGCYRLPTDEDRKNWRKEWLEEYGTKITLEELEKMFVPNLKEPEESIEIEFSLGERDSCWMGKTEDTSGEEVFWLMLDENIRLEFTNFQEMTEASVVGNQSLKSIWDDVTLILYPP